MLLNMNGKGLARAAILAALSVVILYISSILPSVKIAMAAVAGLLCAVALIENSTVSAIGVYVVTTVLGLLILPTKTSAVLYAALFGYYPVVKSLAEKKTGRIVEWIIKLVVFNVVLIVLYLFGQAFIGEFLDIISDKIIVAVIVLNAVFVVYDICFSRLVSGYIAYISPRLKFNR